MPLHFDELPPEEYLPSRPKTAGRAGRAPLDATFPLIYGPFATGAHPVGIVSPPVRAMIPYVTSGATGDHNSATGTSPVALSPCLRCFLAFVGVDRRSVRPRGKLPRKLANRHLISPERRLPG
jgi:hypothetical protein